MTISYSTDGTVKTSLSKSVQAAVTKHQNPQGLFLVCLGEGGGQL